MSLVYLDENPDWEGPNPWADGWEPWEPDECESVEGACCEYCGTVEDIRELPDPFGHRQCCEGCFSLLIGGEDDDDPWRCGTKPRSLTASAKRPTEPVDNGSSGGAL